ncbi:MAG: murein biosynthesis integral membrane protein MurJ [Magnetococcales bacterium]|nr:murein biosynthesis integral membrane protein MurJ [Magnetococcales bacterium]
MRGMLRAVGTISFFTLLSRILGFVRDVVIAHGFGAGMGADAFFVALKLPNFLRRLFAEGAFGTAFVPVISDYLAAGDPRATREAVQAIFTQLLVVLVAVVAVAQVVMPGVVYVAAPGFYDDPEKFQLTVELTRITFPYILFISLVALAGGVLNSHHRFWLPAATPILLNLSLIVGALGIAPFLERPVDGLAWGVFLGGVVQLAIQFPALRRIGLPLRWRWHWGHPATRRVLILMTPSIVGVSVAQINLLFDIFVASWLPVGSISYLYYADRLVEFPLGLIGIAMATVILPMFSAKASRQDLEGLKADLDYALRLVLIINIPATVGLVVLREPILGLLFQRGAFDAETTRLTGQAVMAFGVGLTAFSAVKVISPAFYALKDTRTPVRVAIVCLLSNMVLNVALMFPLQHAGLALATTLSSYLNCGLLLRALGKKLDFNPVAGLPLVALKTGVASLGMTLFLSMSLWGLWSPGMGTLGLLFLVMYAMLGGGVVFLVLARVLQLRELNELIGAIRKGGRKQAPAVDETPQKKDGDV